MTGWKFQIDRSVPKIGVTLGRGEIPIEIKVNPTYIGTSGFIVEVEATSKQGNIVEYAYKVDNEIKETSENNTFEIEGLEANKEYTVVVIATDDNGNKISSSANKITTKGRTYIIKDGISNVELQEYNATITNGSNYMQIKLGPTNARAVIQFDYDLSKYKKIKVDAEYIEGKASVTLVRSQIGSNLLTASVDWLPDIEEARCVQSVDITDKMKEKESTLGLLKSASSGSTEATVYVYNLWLEE